MLAKGHYARRIRRLGIGSWEKERAGDGVRTHDNDVGNVVLYQLSYTRPEQFRDYRLP